MQFHSLWNGEIQGDIQPNTSFFINHLSFSTLIPASSWLPLSPPPSLFHHPPFSLSFSVPPSLSLSLCLSFPVISRHAVGGFCPLGVSTNHAIEPCRHRGTLAHTHTFSLSHKHTLSFSLSLSLSLTHTLSLSLSISLSHTHTLSLSHTHTHTLSLYLSFPLSLSLCLSHTHTHVRLIHSQAHCKHSINTLHTRKIDTLTGTL